MIPSKISQRLSPTNFYWNYTFSAYVTKIGTFFSYLKDKPKTKGHLIQGHIKRKKYQNGTDSIFFRKQAQFWRVIFARFLLSFLMLRFNCYPSSSKFFCDPWHFTIRSYTTSGARRKFLKNTLKGTRISFDRRGSIGLLPLRGTNSKKKKHELTLTFF